ncbi:SDR family NAD(P)-dependent oxidoreductase [Aurantimonas sp. C2-6-R+9]|uniref:SDR family NAD(P)-dependent oxidoreductase n=1 Tax=unclassified Aurantimonas TaxID=2638230 RepID=UPI002E19C418|nr:MULTISPECIES: SDR family NAD(P)-dependent oxidoreductase [unclassified Aurantimonas]MEC5289812.1 SDR family NAD(P)-dependent oxidoreductase [Aurantimonas sp. C2-3-R2]MEC5379779.1 SDR family NAD(P)-dependent oxidoreductase [Aurantimonas sp. C2-6-R+9]MEC5410749.1 SDR family NAD(P)-dependent oxidoreductase [Aurantimonas sp. C2-4-R8]
MTHPVIAEGRIAVVTGGASGIGLAAAKRFAEAGMTVCLVDRAAERLAEAKESVSALSPSGSVLTSNTDVGDRAAVEALAKNLFGRFGTIHLVFDNAGIQPGSDIFGRVANWDMVLRTNLHGVIHVAQIFGERMVAEGEPGLIVVTGSKQGITTPPGDPAYNVAKAGVKAFTEALQHDLRNREGCRIEARLMIPGFVFTPLTQKGRAEKPDAAWTAEQTVEFMLERLGTEDFYILCPDGEVTREMDEKRIAWAAGDLVENRPPLSRWHQDWAEKFKAWAGRN